MNIGYCFIFVLFALLLLVASPVYAAPDPCLVVYPAGPCVYHYNPAEYYTVAYGDSLYDAVYDRGGMVLIDAKTNEIDLSIYQAPNLSGFEMSIGGNDGYFTTGYSLDLVVDGWSNEPTTYHNIQLVFEPDPYECMANIKVDGNSVLGPPYVLAIGDLVVSTPTPNGHNYSDTITKLIEWSGCYGLLMWAYADENYNGVHDGGECFTAFSHDTTIPAARSTWGAIKSLYE
jgi:hypothetical protein